MGHFCVVVGCSSQAGRRRTNGKVGFFRFPKKSKDRREQWVSAIKRINPDKSKWDPNRHSRICSRHFLTGKPSRDVSHPDFKPTIFPTSHVKPSTVTDKSRHDRVLARRARIQEENKVQERLAQQNIEIIKSLIAKMSELETDKNCLLERKRSLVIRKFNLEEAMRQNVEGRHKEECNLTTGRKDVACQTDSGLHDYILGDSLGFSCSREDNDVRCQILSPGYFNQGLLTVLEVIADDQYVRSKPVIQG